MEVMKKSLGHHYQSVTLIDLSSHRLKVVFADPLPEAASVQRLHFRVKSA
jgi:hypothetical protein